MEIAVLLATFNRKDKTLSCLKSLFEQETNSDVKFNVFLTDDNSTDGTAMVLKAQFPSVNIFKGTGNLFWAGGMRNSWKKAIKSKPDFYLLLNDDTLLVKNCITRLLTYFSIKNEDAILIGSTMDNLKNKITYGGHKLYTAGKVQCYNVFSETEYLVCDMANANIMLVPASVVNKIGILSANFTHSIADFDYTLRAGKEGIKTVVVPGVLGFCVDDNLDDEFKIKRNLKQRIAHLKSPKGLAYKEYMGFISTHFPGHRLEVSIKIWLKTLFPFIWRKFKPSNS
ncbi:glycosyltransferase family 2 protein [Pedobacter mendelii]|uniref:Acetylglucosaminyltransferase n=1 Tax=Pedobacter mendelii TaxID=1908240 RepID=A0ABQ2BIY7_9SPHI|nr:glycosyltransferase family 2 protein [Pedobacter mendelii]GGI26913.1 acetylglucosaminyltransferase [Pedobacter mendelii]